MKSKKRSVRDRTIMDLAKAAARTELEALEARQRELVEAFGTKILDGIREMSIYAGDATPAGLARAAQAEFDAGRPLGEKHRGKKAARVPWQARPENAAKVVAWKRKTARAARARARAAK